MERTFLSIEKLYSKNHLEVLGWVAQLVNSGFGSGHDLRGMNWAQDGGGCVVCAQQGVSSSPAPSIHTHTSLSFSQINKSLKAVFKNT